MGTWHLISAIGALLLGTVVLWSAKGTRFHKTVGLMYVICMSIMLASSFMTYRLYGYFGLFHYMSVFATLTLLAGMLPLWLKRPRHNYRVWHINFMYWSVMGLYMAFFSETFTRIPETPFYPMVFAASGLVCVLGVIGHRVYFPKWLERFHKTQAINHQHTMQKG